MCVCVCFGRCVGGGGLNTYDTRTSQILQQEARMYVRAWSCPIQIDSLHVTFLPTISSTTAALHIKHS